MSETSHHGHPGGSAGLKAGAISLGGDFVASVATVAPSSSVAFTLALLLGFSGLATPLAVLVVGVAMLFVSFGYAQMNKWKPSAGAPYVWVGRAVGPTAGIGTGMISVVASTVANIGNITLAGAYFLAVIFPSSTFPSIVTWLVAAIIMAVLVWLAIRGIRPSIIVQTAFIVIEYGAIISFVVLALIHELSHAAPGVHGPSWSYFTINGGFGGFRGLAEAAVVCGFLYAGWEAPLVLGEESSNAKINPGRAAILGTAFLTIWYTFLMVVFQGVSSQGDLVKHGADVLAYAGQILVPGFWGRALPLAVLVAVIGTTQMQMTEPSRILYAMARDRLIPRVFGRVSVKHSTPWWAITFLGVIPPIALIPYLLNTSASQAIGYIISASGLLYLVMYCIIALSCVWFSRSEIIARKGRALLTAGLLPLVGGLFNLVIFIYGLKTQGNTIALVALAGLIICVVIAFIVRARARQEAFFTSRGGRDEPASAEAPVPAAEMD
ncbi:MAG: APC family permease [Streptosporangiaceae bacterium]